VDPTYPEPVGGNQRSRALAAALVLVGTVAVSGCGTETGAEPGPGSSTSAANGTPTSGGSSSAAEAADHSVDPPGPLEDRLYGSDMLIFNETTLSEDMVRRISKLKGVAAVEHFGLAQVVLENRSLQVAAVDPASYRRFTPPGSAQTQEVWDRVAGGEVAITPELGQRLQDDEGELTMGGAKDAPQIHIGAYAEQAEQIDAVVNEKWGEELGMSLGNALLISTDQLSPEAIRKPIQRIVGDDASVQRLDPNAGLDTSVQQTAVLTGGTIGDVVGTFNYTVLGGGRIAPESSWVASHIGTATMPIIGPMTCNKAIFPQLEAALREVVSRGLSDQLHPDEYAGCYYPRFIAGSTTLSNHSFGLAFDLNVPGNQRGTAGEMNRDVVAIFKKWGFAWGGDWNYTDPMHFEMNQLVTPR
jgi:hypothetical protein